MAKKKETGKNKVDELLEKAKKCLSDYNDRESDNIKRAKEAINFRSGDQWPQAVKQDRENPNQNGGARPCPVLDKTNQYVRQIINEERQNRAAIKIRPVDDIADPKVAEVLTGIIRHIEDQSQAIEAYTTGGEHAIDGGFGYWRILTDYCDPMSFDQDIRIKRIPNRFSVALGYHTEPDGADAQEALIWEDMTEDAFKAEFPKAKVDGFDAKDTWKTKDTIRVAEYMFIDRKPIKIHLLEGGKVVTDDELGEETPLNSRESVINQVKWRKITSEEILEEADMLGSYIPVVKVIGNELTMPDGKTRLSGAIESSMDPQRLHNYAHAGFIENVALAPRAPWVAEESQIEGYENDYAMANRANIAVLKYKGVNDENGRPLPPPQRTAPPGVSTGWDRMLQNTEHGIEGAFGMYGPSVGAQSQEKSGIALQEQKSQGMVGNFHFPDNLARSIQHTGRILLEWIPKVYDTERIARMLGEDGEQEMVYLNPDQEQAIAPRMNQMNEKIGTIYNLNVGKYDVTVSTGPSYTAKRQEAVENQLGVINARPELLDIMGDILFKNMDAPGSDKISERLAALLPPQIQQLEQQDKDGSVDPKVQAMMQQVEQAAMQIEQKAQMLQQAEQELNARAQEVGGDKAAIEAERKALDADKRVFMADAKTQSAVLELKAARMMEEIEDATEDKLDPAIIKIAAEAMRDARELQLKEHEAGLQRDEAGEVVDLTGMAIAEMVQSLSMLGGELEKVATNMNAPKSLNIQRDQNGDILAVNGQPVTRDENGNLVGING